MDNEDFGKEILLYKTAAGEELPVKTDGELPKEGFMQILHKTSSGGGRPVAIYNLDVLISVGCRVKSPFNRQQHNTRRSARRRR